MWQETAQLMQQNVSLCDLQHSVQTTALAQARIQGVLKRRPNVCYEDFIAHFTAF
jgi:competence protein ComGC